MIRKLKMEKILSKLREIQRISTMKTSDFSYHFCIDYEEFGFPTKEKEVNKFIKGRTKLWRNSWIVDPLKEIIKEIENEINR